MASCLGIYVDSNVIKYAKVTKERDNVKVESFGMKFYDKLNDAIKQIISETSSYKIPISINLSEEKYNYFHMFSLLNKRDLKKAIETEFEAYCSEKNMNKNAFEGRYILSNELDDKDKIRVIHISSGKTTINNAMQSVKDAKVSTISPIGTSIANIANIKPKENIIIVNIEDKTTITTIINQKIYSVDELEEGSKEILNNINNKENSYSKAYEICKNSTIYTMDSKELQSEENDYLDDIMPTLYKIAEKLKDYLASSAVKFSKIYITGTMSAVNNIDLYFQEFFTNEKCEILRPYFITDNPRINIKDYIEVNSAIAIALQGLGYGIKDVNFRPQATMSELMKVEIDPKKFDFSFNSLKTKADGTERWLLRIAAGVFILTILYSGFSMYLDKEITNKTNEVEEVSADTKAQIALVEVDNTRVKQKTNKYIELTDNLKNINQRIEDTEKSRDRIPNLLMQIMYTIPESVQVTEIENTTGNHIVIKAQAKKYEQLGYFKARLKEDNILSKNTVVSSQGEKDGDYVKVVIEGDLP